MKEGRRHVVCRRPKPAQAGFFIRHLPVPGATIPGTIRPHLQSDDGSQRVVSCPCAARPTHRFESRHPAHATESYPTATCPRCTTPAESVEHGGTARFRPEQFAPADARPIPRRLRWVFVVDQRGVKVCLKASFSPVREALPG